MPTTRALLSWLLALPAATGCFITSEPEYGTTADIPLPPAEGEGEGAEGGEGEGAAEGEGEAPSEGEGEEGEGEGAPPAECRWAEDCDGDYFCDTGRCMPSEGEADCTPGMDQTCNDDPRVSALWGHCNEDGTCECLPGSKRNPATGRCRPAGGG